MEEITMEVFTMNKSFISCNIQTERSINTIFCHGKNYQMDISSDKIAIYEKFQDNNNKWITSMTPAYFITGEEVQYLFMDVGSNYAYNVLSYLHSIGVLK